MARAKRDRPWLGVRRGVYYAFWYDPLRRETKRKSLSTQDEAAAKEAFSAFTAARYGGVAVATPWRTWAVKLCRRARENAKQKGRLYALTPEFIEQMLAEQQYRCAVTNMRFSAESTYRNPFAPSLDQVTPGKGYVIGNVRITTVIANTAMNGWGEQPLRRMILESRLANQPVSRSVEISDATNSDASELIQQIKGFS